MRVSLTLLAATMTLAALSFHAQSAQPAATPDFKLIGFASVESGTIGGKGGKTNPVATAEGFRAATGATEPLHINGSGLLDLARDTVNVAVNKTIIGGGYEVRISDGILCNLRFANPHDVDQGYKSPSKIN